MAGRGSTNSFLRGKWMFASSAFVLCVVFYIYYTDQPISTVKLQGNIIPAKRQSSNFSLEAVTQGNIIPARSQSSTSNLKEVTAIQDKLLHSRWINLFPSLKHMVTQIDDTFTNHMTSAAHTFISIKNSRDRFEVGQILTAYITAVDGSGQNKSYGGDFFFVSLRRSSSKIDGVSCEIYDEMNGSYRVTCILLWSGEAILTAVLIHPSESIYQMMKMYSSEREYGVLMNITTQNSNAKKEHALCTIGFPEKKQEELCDYSNPTNGERWKCIKPKSGECAKLTWSNNRVSNHKLLAFYDDVYFRKGINYNVKIGGSGTTFTVKESQYDDSNYVDSDISILSPSPSAPSGWFFESRWMSNQTMATDFSAAKLQHCVQNTDFYFIGDSTIRQWYNLFKGILKIIDHGPNIKSVWSYHRDGYDKKLNVTIHYRAHGQPLHNIGPPDAMPYISDTLDSIEKGGKGTKVLITFGYHFELFDPDVFSTRLHIIKASMKKLLKRLPGTSIYFKGLHTHDYYGLCPSPWIPYRYDTMMRHEFMNIEGVTYLPLWDLTSLAGNKALHPAPPLLKQEVGFFLTFCNK